MSKTLIAACASLALASFASASQGQEATAQPAPPAQPAPAQDQAAGPKGQAGVEEIVVTSRLREESIQEVPIAVTQFGQEAIEEIAPSTLRDFDGLTPNLFIGMNTAGPGASAIYIRGLGYADIEKTQTPNVGVVVDGVFIPSSTGQLIDTFDIQSIEVNRGPQAILWGRNTSGGTIVVRRGQPELGEWGAKFYTSYGDYKGLGDGGAFKIQGVANIPLTAETLALRVGYTFKDEDGYAKNVVDGENRGAVDYQAFNAKLLFQPTENLSAVLNWDWIEDRSDIPPQDARWDGNDPYRNKSDRKPKEKAPYDVSLLSLELNYELPFDAKFTSITAYWNSDDFVLQDFDAGVSNPADPTQNDPQIVFARLHTHRAQTFDVFSQELRLQGTLLDDSITYTTGFYYARDDHDHEQRTEQQLQLSAASFPPGVCVPGIPGFSGPISPVFGQLCVLPTTFSIQNTSLDNYSWALFGSLEYDVPFLEGLNVNFGVRYIDERKKFKTRFAPIVNNTLVGSISGAPTVQLSGLEDSWDDAVFEAGANYQVLDNLMGYYRFAQGFRSGGFSLRGSDPVNWPITFEPEDVDAHEIGLKSSWFEDRLIVNMAGFYNKIHGSQGSSIISGVTPVGTNTLILNADKSETYGFELQSALQVLEGLDVNFTLGWQKGSLIESTQNTHNLAAAAGNTVCFVTSGGTSEAACPDLTFKDLELARLPELTWSIGASYRLDIGPGTLVIGSRYKHNDDFWIIPPAIDPVSGVVTNTPVPQDAYSLWDANLSYEFPVMERKVRVGFVGRNLTDKQYKEQELPLGPGGFRGWGPPRYVGGELSIEL